MRFLDSNDGESMTSWWDSLGPEWVRLNLVTDALGHLADANGTTRGLTGGADRVALAALRRLSDVVILGGETVRREPESVPRDRPVIVVSKSANIPIEVIRRARAGITVLHAPSVSAPPATTGVPLSRFTGKAILTATRSLGHTRIVCEGGPRLMNVFLASGVVDELCVTISPHLGDPIGPTLPDSPGVLTSVAHDDFGFRYLRRTLNGAPRKFSRSTPKD